MIKIENVSFQYSSGDKAAIENINLNIERGELVLLLGESGSGKTTLTRLINGLVPSFYDGTITGKVNVEGTNIVGLPIQAISNYVGSVFQDPRSQFFTTETTGEIAFSCENYGMTTEEIRERITKAVNVLQIDRLANRSIFDLSSGEKQLIAIASVYAYRPPIIVFDEPSSNLDNLSISKLGQVLEELKKQGITIVISEHRIHYLKELVDRVIYLKEGKIEKIYSGDDFRALSNEDLNSKGLRSLDLLSIKLPNETRKNVQDEKLVVEDLSFKYDKSDMVLQDLSLSASSGNIIGVVGRNGAGKSTFVDIVCGLQKEKKGRISINSKRLHPRDRIKNTYLVMQDSDYQLFTESVEKEIFLGNKIVNEKDRDILGRLGLEEYADRHPASLSGGQKQRLCFAVAYVRDSDVLCLDEPTSGLDYNSMVKVSNLLKDLASQEKTIILTSHDYEFLTSVCTHFFQIKDEADSRLYKLEDGTLEQLAAALQL